MHLDAAKRLLHEYGAKDIKSYAPNKKYWWIRATVNNNTSWYHGILDYLVVLNQDQAEDTIASDIASMEEVDNPALREAMKFVRRHEIDITDCPNCG